MLPAFVSGMIINDILYEILWASASTLGVVMTICETGAFVNCILSGLHLIVEISSVIRPKNKCNRVWILFRLFHLHFIVLLSLLFLLLLFLLFLFVFLVCLLFFLLLVGGLLFLAPSFTSSLYPTSTLFLFTRPSTTSSSSSSSLDSLLFFCPPSLPPLLPPDKLWPPHASVRQ